MSADFTKILVKDNRLHVVDNIKYAVVKGGQNVTMSQFRAISATNSQIVFNIQVPSEQTIIDRRVLLQTDLTLVVQSTSSAWTNANPPVFNPAAPSGCGYGSYASLAAYPLHELMSVASATINNNTVSINIRDVLPFIIRALDKGELNAYNATTATAVDSYLSYSDGLAGAANPLGGGFPTLDTDLSPRGSIALTNYARAVNGVITTETFTFHISEPLLLSPFIYCNPKSNSQGFYGIQNMNFVLNIGDASRVFRGLNGVDGADALATNYSAGTKYASPAGVVSVGTAGSSLPFITSVSLGTNNSGSAFGNTTLLFTFLTPHPSDLMPARNIVPYYELPRYITNVAAPAPLALTTVGSNSFIPYDVNGGTLVASQTLQLNQIPDKLILMVRKPMASQSYGDADAYLPIRKISINFNNNSGILSAARCEDLYRMSKDNGSNQHWNEWVGYVNSSYSNISAITIPNSAVLSVSPAATAPVFSTFPTVGSCLMLEFGKDIQLIEDFFAPGSLGNFNIQVNVFIENNNDTVASGANLELVMITMNSGVFVCERGTSSTYTGILTRADVLEASEQDAYSHADVKRMVGGGFLDMLKSGVSKLAPLVKAVAPMVAPHAKEYLSKKGAMGKLASQGISALGYGHSGAGMHASGRSGAGMSGGALQGRYM
jgi:hypothetical protein